MRQRKTRTEQLLERCLEWMWEHAHDEAELVYALREHLGMTDEEIRYYGFDLEEEEE